MRARGVVRTGLSFGAAVGVFASVLIVAPQLSVADPPPPNPSDGQLNSAQARKDALATQVGRLSAQIAAGETRLLRLQGEEELAQQKYAYAYSQLLEANVAVAKARKQLAAAQRRVDKAHDTLVAYVQATYMSASIGGPADTLLTAEDPSALLEQGAIQHYQTSHQIDAIGVMQRATIARSNAEAASRLAQQRQKELTKKAKEAQQAAAAAVRAKRAEQRQLQSALATKRTTLASARSALATLTNRRAAYNAWKVEQARIEAARRRAAREQAERLRQQNGGGNGSGGGNSQPIAPSGGSWSAARAQKAVDRAMSTLGTPYAWAGGNSGGPTMGVCDPSNGAAGDCHVYGYDCSGLVMYAWGPYTSLPHYAASQYVVAGSYHPGSGDLRAGDLIFWSTNGSIAGIHHVAVYIGGGQIVEAPYSGSNVRTASLYQYGSFFGATRPLT